VTNPTTQVQLPGEPQPTHPAAVVATLTKSGVLTKDGLVRATITGIDIPFGDLIVLLVKLALAAIPAAIILFIIGTLISAAFAILGIGLAGLGRH